jgi:glutaconate CoA-transferase, subunit A
MTIESSPGPAGEGVLFSDPSADAAREFFAKKSRSLTDKRATVKEAVERHVADGAYLAIGGFGCDRIPTAVVHEILRQQKQNLRFAGHTATHDFQILCAGNMTGHGKTLAAVDIAYVVGLEARGLSPHARRVVESGEIACTEWTNYALAVRFKAAAMGLSFLPARSMLGTDTMKMSAARIIHCPFTGSRYVALPALFPDVAAIHVHECDMHGNCRIRGITVADLDLARAAKRLIITCERLIPTEEIRRDPSQTVIPFYCVDAVCEVPYGSYPGNMAYEYFSDEAHLSRWLEVEKDLTAFRSFLDEHIYSTRNFGDYLQHCGGLARMQELRRQEFLLDEVKPRPS